MASERRPARFPRTCTGSGNLVPPVSRAPFFAPPGRALSPIHRICAQIPSSAPTVVSGSTLRPYPCPPPLLGYAYTPPLTCARPSSTYRSRARRSSKGDRVRVAGKGASKGGGIVPWSCPLPTTHVRTMEENPALRLYRDLCPDARKGRTRAKTKGKTKSRSGLTIAGDDNG